jgi:fatty-acyl-CoA synthase
MTDVLSATLDVASADAGRSKVFRSELNPVDFLVRAAFMYPEKTAVVHGERVATLLFNSPAMLEAYFGVPAAGGVLVAINNRLSGAEVGYILEHSGARYLLLDSELEALVAGIELPGVTVIRYEDTGSREDPYEQFLAAASPETPESWLEDEEETISINYTSGATGRPKGVKFTYRGAYLNALGEVIHAGMSSDSVYLWTLPMFHCNGWCFPWAVTAAAARHVSIRTVDPGRVWELIDGEGVTHYNGAPTVQLAIIHHPSAHRLERPVTVMVAAAPPSAIGRPQRRRLRAAGFTPAISPCGIPTATSSCATAARTSSSPAARTSRASRYSGRSSPTPACSRRR